MTPFATALKFLEKRGIKYTLGSEYVGDPGVNRRLEYRNIITSIEVPFSAKEWVDIVDVVDISGNYLGACCSTTSAAKELLLTLLRNGRRADGNDLSHLFGLLEHHECLTADNPLSISSPHYDFSRSRYKRDPIYRLSVVYSVIKDFMLYNAPAVRIAPSDDERSQLAESVKTIQECATTLSWCLLCNNLLGANETDLKSESSRLLAIARLRPALHNVIRQLDKVSRREFRGYAICETEAPDVVVVGHLGPCIFPSRKDAEAQVDMWAYSEDQLSAAGKDKQSIRARFTIRPVNVSSSTGLFFLDKDDNRDYTSDLDRW